MTPLIAEHLNGIQSLGRGFGVARLEVFGSAMSEQFDPSSSDVDVIVTYPPGYDVGPWLMRFNELEERLAILLGRPVDLVMAAAPAMHNERFRSQAEKTRTVVYDASQVAEVA